MIRIRRFEEKCYELYTQEKIRGFLHLYDGEEAVAVGVSRRWSHATGWCPPTASTATRWPAA
jgi:TPP-dependent pyruvate/acetoin dehydrogenase alpha subunit